MSIWARTPDQVAFLERIARLGITGVVMLNQDCMDEVRGMIASAGSIADVHSVDDSPAR